ncbi:aminotransferase class III-fold pyridoxal phosphate-dependent enzyme [Pedobacter cryoconitis]|nr:aminotransferase class III-fold pyridoxal phosphate-dependent enzyme [Pedobacter cryoconitis]
MPGDKYRLFSDVCKQHGIISILDLSRIKKINAEGLLESVIENFDIVAWGEVFTNFQVPFGAFSTKHEIFKVWNNISHCSTHSSTFGGNGMVLSYVKDCMEGMFPVFKKSEKYKEVLDKIEISVEFRQQVSRNHLNAFTTMQFSVIHPYLYFDKAEGAFLQPGNDQNEHLKLDCVGGSGCNTLGHNRSDILLQIVKKHDDDVDYLNLLNKKVTEATGLERLLQGVSGASAVEAGITLALMANPGKKKILIFSGNFGGKTLVSLNSTSGNHEFFKPLYEHVIEFNANQPNARDELRKILTSGEIALVWMEIIQGRSLRSLEKSLLDLVNLHKTDYKYLIGADEILNGIYRTGDFLSFNSHLLQPDIITFAKAFSGMILPVSFTAISEEVYQNAKIKNGNLVNKLERLYVNQLTAHIAIKFLEAIEKENIKDNIQRSTDILIAGFPAIIQQSPLLSGVDAFGLHLRINLAIQKFPFSYLGYERSNAVLTYLFYTKANIFCLFGRLLPPLNIRESEINHILQGFSKVFSYHPLYFFWIGLKQNQAKRWKLFKMKFTTKIF